MNVGDSSKGLALLNSIVPVSRETEDRFCVYHDELLKWQARMNLVAPSTLDEAWGRHFADSAQCFALTPGAKNWVDLGSGAGFPGLVTAILLANGAGGSVHLVESNGKKCAFLSHVVRACNLNTSNVTVQIHNGRIEDVLSTLPPAEVLTARALASLETLFALTSCHLTMGAVGLFPKGRGHESEILTARQGWSFKHKSHPSRFGSGSAILEIRDLEEQA